MKRAAEYIRARVGKEEEIGGREAREEKEENEAIVERALEKEESTAKTRITIPFKNLSPLVSPLSPSFRVLLL